MRLSIAFPILFCLMQFGSIDQSCGQQSQDSKTDSKPNFIVVFCDNLGYGDIEPFGSKIHRTPNLNRMAAEGRKFTHFCVTAGVCTPSRASLMTGCYSQRVGMHYNERDGWVLRPVSRYGLNPNEQTIAEVLKAEGYATGMIGKWHLGDQSEFLPTRQGFDWFFGVPYSDDMTERVWTDGTRWPPLPLMENDKVIEAPCDRNGLTKRYTEEAKEWITKNKDNPFFLYFPQAMPGSTRTPFASPEFKGKSNNGPWGDSIEELDWSIGELMDHLRELRIADNTLVVWTSDNGAPINPDPKDLRRGSNGPLHGRGYTTGEGAFRVPTIVWQPGKVPAGTVCSELATTMDLLPTFAALAGSKKPFKNKIDGHSIVSQLFDDQPAKSPYEVFYYYQQKQLQAVRSGPWKLFLAINQAARHPHLKPKEPPKELLFNVVNDVACKHNVAEQNPEIVKRLKRLAEDAREELGDQDRRGRGQRSIGSLPPGKKPRPQTLPEDDKKQSALDLIESERGGRHWVDAATDPPRSPESSLETLQIEDGFEIELFAAEPLVKDPVAMTFDQLGRMFVLEYGDYPIGPAQGEDPLSKIVMLEDTDNNGQADRRTVFADKLDFAHSLMAFRDGLLVGAKTKLVYIRDTDNDGVADQRETLFDGFDPAHPQMQIGCPRMGIDNWIYCNYGPGLVASAKQPEKRVRLPRKDFRFHPKTLEFGPDSGLGQFGNTIDRWGNRYYCSNRNPIMTTFLTPGELSRNPFHIVPKAFYDVGKAGGETRVYPLVSMKSNHLSHAGTHTSACGTTAYIGEHFPGSDMNSVRENVFVCEPIGHLVTRSIVRRDGLKLVAMRSQPKRDFVVSTDTWFRPSSLETGPDGALYLADMYRLWVEHPKFLPPEIAAKLDWRAGDDRGRIYRILPANSEGHRFSPPQNLDDQVALLKHENGWQRFLGQRLIVEGKSQFAISKVRELLHHVQPTTRLHALWTLEGMSGLVPSDLLTALRDANLNVRLNAIKLAHRWMDKPEILHAVGSLINDPNQVVRFQIALALDGSDSEQATDHLVALAATDGLSSDFVDGLITAAKSRAGLILKKLLREHNIGDQIPPKTNLVRQLAATVGARGDVDELNALLELLTIDESAAGMTWWRFAAINGFGEGLSRYRGELGRLSLAKLIEDPPRPLSRSSASLQPIFESISKSALDPKTEKNERLEAVKSLGFQPLADVASDFANLITTDQPLEVQTAAIGSLSKSRSPLAAKIVLENWNQLGPAVRGAALAFTLKRKDSTMMTLGSIESGEVPVSMLSIDQRVRLLKHADARIRKRSKLLFGGGISSNRIKVAKDYERALSLQGSVFSGKKVFERVCAGCHRLHGSGFEAGPDLSDIRNRSRTAILYDILDPNSKVEPRFTSYSIQTVDGFFYNGLIESETTEAVVVKMAEGKRQVVGRNEIELIKASQLSLMPEGIEKDISVQQMADLLEFLKATSDQKTP